MENYGFFKRLIADNPYQQFTKTLNSAKTTVETRKTLKRITVQDVEYAHMGQLVIKDGICYATFIQNTGTDGEDHDSSTSGVVLAVFSLETVMAADFHPEKDVLYFPIGSKGGICAGYKAASIYKDNSMCLAGDYLYICFSFITEDGTSHVFQKTFDTNSKTWVDEKRVTLCYRGQDYDFSDETINRIYVDHHIEPRAKGLIELVSAWSEYRGEYYATGLTIGGPNHGLIVKTRDFCTMDFVDVIPFNDKGCAEIASCVYRDTLYVACRQDYGIPYLYMGSFDLKTKTWNSHHKIPDGNVRPWFFEYRDELFLINTTQELHRKYTNISRVRTGGTEFSFFNRYCPTEIIATIKNCGSYFATASYQGEIYFVSTYDTESFGKLCLCLFDEEEVNKKLLDLFE